MTDFASSAAVRSDCPGPAVPPSIGPIRVRVRVRVRVSGTHHSKDGTLVFSPLTTIYEFRKPN